ncbi:ABC transporter ATP-binding protein [bacterium]|nr:ABC transporter ATP-binding protein [bacterium]
MLIPLMDNVFTPQRVIEPDTQLTVGEAWQAFSGDIRKYIGEHRGEENWLEELLGEIKSNGINYLNRIPPREILKVICIAIIILFFLKNLFFYLNKLIFIIVENKVTRDLRNDLYAKFHALSMSFFHKHPTGELTSRLFNDIFVIDTLTVNVFAILIRDIIMVIIYAAIAIYISSGLFLYILLVIPPIVYAVSYLNRKLRKYSGRRQEKIAQLYSLVQDVLPGIQVVKAFNMENYEVQRFRKENQKFFKYINKLKKYTIMSIPLSDISGALIAVFVLWYGGNRFLSPETSLTTGRFFAFLGALLSMITPMKNIIKEVGNIQKASVAVKRVFDLFEIVPEIQDDPRAVAIENFNDSLIFKDLYFKYDSSEPVLENINLEIKKGQIVAFVGHSGGGKTTLVNLLPRFYDPTSGVILLDGFDLKMVKLSSLRALLGIVTQDVILFNDSILNNIAYGLESVNREQVEDACRAANALEFIKRLPNGFDTKIGERGCNLSGGQKQRLAIARAILKNPPILIFDEATSSLDTESEALVQQAINNLIKNRTALVIAHRLSTITHADLIVVVEGGKIVETGSHHQLLQKGTRYKQLYDLQFREDRINPEKPL